MLLKQWWQMLSNYVEANDEASTKSKSIGHPFLSKASAIHIYCHKSRKPLLVLKVSLHGATKADTKMVRRWKMSSW
jgi:hypothetical protein